MCLGCPASRALHRLTEAQLELVDESEDGVTVWISCSLANGSLAQSAFCENPPCGLQTGRRSQTRKVAEMDAMRSSGSVVGEGKEVKVKVEVGGRVSVETLEGSTANVKRSCGACPIE